MSPGEHCEVAGPRCWLVRFMECGNVLPHGNTLLLQLEIIILEICVSLAIFADVSHGASERIPMVIS